MIWSAVAFQVKGLAYSFQRTAELAMPVKVTAAPMQTASVTCPHTAMRSKPVPSATAAQRRPGADR
jgi:hypothetical protein